MLGLGLGLLVVGLGGLAGVAFQSGGGLGECAVSRLAVFYLVTVLAVSGFAWVNPSIHALVSRRTDASHQGEVLGVNQGVAALGRIAGPFLGSLLFPLTVPPVLPYVSAVVLVLLAGGLAYRGLGRTRSGSGGDSAAAGGSGEGRGTEGVAEEGVRFPSAAEFPPRC